MAINMVNNGSKYLHFRGPEIPIDIWSHTRPPVLFKDSNLKCQEDTELKQQKWWLQRNSSFKDADFRDFMVFYGMIDMYVCIYICVYS